MIQVRTCVSVHCDQCGSSPGGPGFEVHWPTEDAALDAAAAQGWLVGPGGRLWCSACGPVLMCEADGHEFSQWGHPSTPEGHPVVSEYRHCRRCGLRESRTVCPHCRVGGGGVMDEPRWYDLDPAQADGLACVICTRNLLWRPISRVPVGRSVTGSQVMACMGSCAEKAALPVWWLRIPDEAWTAAGITFLAAVEGATTTGNPCDAYPDDLVTPTVRSAAPLIVAAELRRLATQYQPRIDSLGGLFWATTETE